MFLTIQTRTQTRSYDDADELALRLYERAAMQSDAHLYALGDLMLRMEAKGVDTAGGATTCVQCTPCHACCLVFGIHAPSLSPSNQPQGTQTIHSTPPSPTNTNTRARTNGRTDARSGPVLGVAQALSYIETAAEQGDVRALRRLAEMYEGGEEGVVGKDTQKALEYFKCVGG